MIAANTEHARAPQCGPRATGVAMTLVAEVCEDVGPSVFAAVRAATPNGVHCLVGLTRRSPRSDVRGGPGADRWRAVPARGLRRPGRRRGVSTGGHCSRPGAWTSGQVVTPRDSGRAVASLGRPIRIVLPLGSVRANSRIPHGLSSSEVTGSPASTSRACQASDPALMM